MLLYTVKYFVFMTFTSVKNFCLNPKHKPIIVMVSLFITSIIGFAFINQNAFAQNSLNVFSSSNGGGGNFRFKHCQC